MVTGVKWFSVANMILFIRPENVVSTIGRVQGFRPRLYIQTGEEK